MYCTVGCIFVLYSITKKQQMEFLTKLTTKSETGDFRHFNQIEVGKYALSIQASMYHYCSPRETLDKDQYYSMEMAIFYNDKWLRILTHKSLKKFERYNELIERAENVKSSACVYGWVPVDLIEAFYQFLKSNK